jgi:hypothetical protein
MRMRTITEMALTDEQMKHHAEQWQSWVRRRAALSARLRNALSCIELTLPIPEDIQLALLCTSMHIPEYSERRAPVATRMSAQTSWQEGPGDVQKTGLGLRSYPVLLDNISLASAEDSVPSICDRPHVFSIGLGIFNGPPIPQSGSARPSSCMSRRSRSRSSDLGAMLGDSLDKAFAESVLGAGTIGSSFSLVHHGMLTRATV